MKLTKMIALGLALSFNAMAADSTATGTITFSGIFSPKVQSVEIALYDCGTDATLNDCQALAAVPATFGAFNTNASIDLDESLNEEVRYIAYRAKAKMFLFKNDKLEISAALATEDDKLNLSFESMKFEKVGSSFGQTTLGDAAGNLETGDSMLTGSTTLTSTSQTIFTSEANAKVVSAMTDTSALYTNGVIAVSTKDDATSTSFNTKINLSFTARDL